jgi:hypothetical protein
MSNAVKNQTRADGLVFCASHRVTEHSLLKHLFRAWSIFGTCCLLALLCEGFPASGAVNVTQHHNHLSRDGLYIDPAFTNTLAAALTRDEAFDGTIIGGVYAQPLYIEGGPGGRAVVIAVTESNYVFALDAIDGSVVWQTNVVSPVGSGILPCGNVGPPVGITGTPVVDLPSRALFFNSITVDLVSSTVEHLIYSLNVDTGALNPGWPVNVNSNAVSGSTIFNSLAQGERGALTVIGGTLYVPYGGLYGDCGTYHGWVVGVPLNDPSTVMAWATTADKGGIWAVGGVASDGVDPFVATGNTASPSTWGGGESIVHLTPDLVLTGTTNYWAPTNWLSLDNSDTDIGGSGPVLVTVPGATPSNLVVALGKDGNMYLLNRTNLGGIGKPVAQKNVVSSAIRQAAATYKTTNGTYVVFANSGNLYSYLIGASNPPTITYAWTANENGVGSPFVTSTDGTNNVVVWGIGAQGNQRLYGFDGDTGAPVYNGGGANELMANTGPFITGIVARGRIYVAGQNQVYAFTLPGTVTPFTLTNLTILPSGAFQFSFTNTPGALFNVFGTTNLAEPFTNWLWLDSATEVSLGQYQFTDTQAPGNTARFYQVVWP